MHWAFRHRLWLPFVAVGLLLTLTVAVWAATDLQEATQTGVFWADLKSVTYNVVGGNVVLEACYYADFPAGGPRLLNGVMYLDVDRDATTGSTPATVTFDRPGFTPTTVLEPDEFAGNGRSEGSEYRVVWSLQAQTAGSGTLPNSASPNSGLWQWTGSAWTQLSTSVAYQFVDSDSSGAADCLRFSFPEAAIGSPSSPDVLLWSVPQMWDLQWLVQADVRLKPPGNGDGITVDGEPDDWASVTPIATLTDTIGDGDPAEIDLTELRVTNDDAFLYVYMKVAGAGTTDTDAPGRQGYNQEQKWYRSQWLYIDANRDGTYERKVAALWELNGSGQIIFAVRVLDAAWNQLALYSYYGAYSDTTYDPAVAPTDPGDGSGGPCSPGAFCAAARLDTTITAADEGVLEFRVPLSDLGLTPGATIGYLTVGDTFGEFQDYVRTEPGKTTYLTPSEYAGQVVINEVLYRQTYTSGTDNDEFVELYVTQDVDMCGWTISDGNVVGGDAETPGIFSYTFNPTDGCQFRAGDYIVIWVGTDNPTTQAPQAALQVHLGRSVKLNNNGDDIWLFDADGEIVDYMAYGADNGINDQGVLPPGFWNANAPTVPAAGQSLSLTPNGQDTNTGNDWEPTTSGSAPGPITRDTDPLADRLSSVGVNNNGLDYGDAPTSYGLAAHSPDTNLYLGSTLPDPEDAPFYSAAADGDDADTTDDEDGVALFPPLDTSAATYTLDVQVNNPSSTSATLAGWIDFDRNGTFDPDEFAAATVPAGTTGTVALTWSSIPADITAGPTFARLRLARTALTGADAATVDGIGEVEDFALSIATPTPTPTFTPTPTNTPTPTPTPTFTPTPTNTPTPTPTFTPTPTNTPTPTPTLPPFDPPVGEKIGTVNGWPVLRWRQVWINPNTTAMTVRIEDPIPEGTVYIGNLTCEARGVSSTTLCTFDAGQNAVIWEGVLGPDPGATTEDTAANEVVIVFEVRAADPERDTFTNTSTAYWDQNGNGVIDPGDPKTLTQAVLARPTLPDTGFAPGRVTVLPPIPGDMAYQNLGPVWLEIPKLGLRAPIVGVPQREGAWPVDWLWDQVGWLEGTAFPGWSGNTVLTGHVTLPSGLPGPFAHLQALEPGDWIVLHLFGEIRVYRVVWNRVVRPDALWVLGHTQGDVLTLMTCADWNEAHDHYEARRVVRAVPVP